jgi:hypothetical protein
MSVNPAPTVTQTFLPNKYRVLLRKSSGVGEKRVSIYTQKSIGKVLLGTR